VTLGKNAVGDPPGNNGQALVFNTEAHIRFADLAAVAGDTRPMIPTDFSQGVIIEERGNAAKNDR
jgi:hypothetical protein